MTMASWNGMSWECGPKTISYLESLSTSFDMDTQNNADKEGKAPTEEVGLSPIEISFSTTYRIETGTPNIQATIDLWKTMIGKSAPLIIWNNVFGPDLLQLQSVAVSNVTMRPDGLFTAATLTFKFKEYIETPVSVEKKEKTTTTKSTASAFTTKVSSTNENNTAKTIKTAIDIGPTKTEKARKKTYYDIKAEQTRDR